GPPFRECALTVRRLVRLTEVSERWSVIHSLSPFREWSTDQRSDTDGVGRRVPRRRSSKRLDAPLSTPVSCARRCDRPRRCRATSALPRAMPGAARRRARRRRYCPGQFGEVESHHGTELTTPPPPPGPLGGSFCLAR